MLEQRMFFALSCALAMVLSAQASLQVTYSSSGVNTLSYNGVTLVNTSANQGDAFQIGTVTHIRPDGSTFSDGGSPQSTSMDLNANQLTWNFSWGKVRTTFNQVGDRLNITIVINNTDSVNALAGANIFPFFVRFPVQPTGWTDVNLPQVGFNTEGPTVVSADYGSGMLVFCNDDTSKPLGAGLFSNNQTASQHMYMLWISTIAFPGQPTFWPTINRKIPAGGSDTYTVSMRFAPSGSSAETIAADIYAAYSQSNPAEICWPDRRAIGTIHLSNPPMGVANNPRNWFGDASVNINTPSGLASFQQRMLALADSSVSILKGMNAQGMIVWDIEGQQYPQATSYLGDPPLLAQLAPEMDPIADAFFKKFRDAGLSLGCCARPQHLVVNGNTAYQDDSASVDPETELRTKVTYAYNRWHITIFYVDSNGSTDSPIDAQIFHHLLDSFPDCLFVPEHKNTAYFAYTAPYAEFDLGYVDVPSSARQQYPGAFWCNYVPPDNNPSLSISQYASQFVQAVRNGDILMFRGWYNDSSASPQIASIYQQAGDVLNVRMTYPFSGMSVSGTINLTACAWGNRGAPAGVQFQVDGANYGAEDTSYPYSTSLNTSSLSAGQHAVTAVARNNAGLRSTATAVNFIVGGGNGGVSPVITSSSTANGTVGQAFSYQITASGSPTSYNATGLPAGLNINTGNGLISGTPTAAGSSSVTITAANSYGTGSASLSLTISASGTAPVITSATAAVGTVNQSFSYQITASGSPTSYNATGLPAGLSVNTGNGLISGTPTAGNSSVTITAVNSYGTGQATLNITINAAGSAPAGLVGWWKLDESSGMTAADSSGDGNNGTLNGAPAWQSAGGHLAGALSFNNISDFVDCGSGASLNTPSVTVAFWMKPSHVAVMGPVDKLPMNSGVGYAMRLRDTGAIWFRLGSEPGTEFDVYGAPNSYAAGVWTHVAATFDSASGAAKLYVNGVLAAQATYAMTLSEASTHLLLAKENKTANEGYVGSLDDVRIYDHALTASDIATVMAGGSVGSGNPPVITSGTTANGTVGQSFSYQITASGSPTSYNATGLPAGLSINTGSGLISGTPTVAGNSSATISAINGSGTGQATLALTINAATPAPVITSATTAAGTVNQSFSYQITASGSPTSYNATGLPAGLNINTGNGLISGTPTAAGNSSVTISAINGSGTGQATLNITINAAGTAPTGLIGWWKLDESSGTTAADSSGNGNNGTLSGAPAWQQAGGHLAGALNFNNISDFVDCGSAASLNTPSVTVAFWMKPSKVAVMGPVDKLPMNTGVGYAVRLRDTGAIWFRLGSEPGTQVDVYGAPNSYASGVWTHVAGTFDSASGSAKLYINGVLGAQTTYAGTLSTASTHLLLAKENKTSNEGYAGALDDVRVYDHALTSSEIATVMEGGSVAEVIRFVPAGMSAGSTGCSFSWSGATGATNNFLVYRCTNLLIGNWQLVAPSIGRSGTGTNVWTDTNVFPQAFYRVATPNQ
jgi:hypothetical protein